MCRNICGLYGCMGLQSEYVGLYRTCGIPGSGLFLFFAGFGAELSGQTTRLFRVEDQRNGFTIPMMNPFVP